MSYFPILKALGCQGETSVFNFPPNNWEELSGVSRYLNVSCSDGDRWLNRCLGSVQYGDSATLTQTGLNTLFENVCPDATFFLTLTNEVAREVSDTLPPSFVPKTSVPAWRASLGLLSPSGTSSSYQGEIDPFPAPGSLLTFGYFLQPSAEISNSLLFVNLERSAKQRNGFMELRDAKHPSKLLAEFEVINNRVNIISLDNLGFTDESLPLLVCRQMSGIPLYFSHTHDFRALSLEHTHPPASTVIHGDRFAAQKIMKTFWFSEIGR